MERRWMLESGRDRCEGGCWLAVFRRFRASQGVPDAKTLPGKRISAPDPLSFKSLAPEKTSYH